MDGVYRLGGLLQSKLTSIELIPGDGKEWLEAISDNDHAPFILMDGNLGIPEKTLYKLYMHAVQGWDQKRFEHGTLSLERATELLKISAVVLIANSGHSTALNLRKNLISNLFMDPKSELAFLEALFTVKQSAKVSALWHHRRWLLQFVFSTQTTKECGDDEGFVSTSLPAESILKEIAISSQAATIYPRNYHSWLHRTLCIRSALQRAAQEEAYLDLLVDEKAALMKWIDLNVSDYSAVHCLVNLCVGLLSLGNWKHDDKVRLVKEIPEHASDLAQRYPTHEALWLYVRLADQLAPDGWILPGSSAFDADVKIRLKEMLSSSRSLDSPSYTSLAARHLAWKSLQDQRGFITENLIKDIVCGSEAVIHKLCE